MSYYAKGALADAITSGMVEPTAEPRDFQFVSTGADGGDDVTGSFWPPIKGLSEVENMTQPHH